MPHLLGLLGFLAGGCASTHVIPTHRLLERQAQLDFSGLKATQESDILRVASAPPLHWRPLPLQQTALFSHQQWKSPTGSTGAGVVYLHLPLPMGAKMLLWLAKLEYSKGSKDGKLIGEWTDELGRPWFEGENAKYHVRGYAVVDGFSAWIVYSGYKLTRPLNEKELGLANRYVETVIPTTGERHPSSANLADGGKFSGFQKN